VKVGGVRAGRAKQRGEPRSAPFHGCYFFSDQEGELHRDQRSVGQITDYDKLTLESGPMGV